MKKFLLLFLPLIFIFNSIPVLAHGVGLPPFYKINGQYAGSYPLQLAYVTSSSMEIPQDIAPENYLVNQPISFSIETDKLPFSSDVAKKTTFTTDFGDGTKSILLADSHAYSKIGTYILRLYADYGQEEFKNNPQVIDTVYLNILPNKDYQLPNSIITVNDKKITNPQASLNLDLNNEIKFGVADNKSSSKIVQYNWDFSDDQASSQTSNVHKYKLPQYFATPMLRVKDANEFWADSYVRIVNSGKNEATADSSTAVGGPNLNNILKSAGLPVVVILILALGFLGAKKYSDKKKSS